MVVAVYDDDAGSSSGSIYVFRTSDGGANYGQVAKLTASDAASGDKFGWSVAIDGSTIVVGASGDEDGGSASGSAYVFRTTDGGATYVEVAKLTAALMPRRTMNSASPWPSLATPSWLGQTTRKLFTSSSRPTAAPRTARWQNLPPLTQR